MYDKISVTGKFADSLNAVCDWLGLAATKRRIFGLNASNLDGAAAMQFLAVVGKINPAAGKSVSAHFGP